jgi:hypothetical protein
MQNSKCKTALKRKNGVKAQRFHPVAANRVKFAFCLLHFEFRITPPLRRPEPPLLPAAAA